MGFECVGPHYMYLHERVAFEIKTQTGLWFTYAVYEFNNKMKGERGEKTTTTTKRLQHTLRDVEPHISPSSPMNCKILSANALVEFTFANTENWIVV